MKEYLKMSDVFTGAVEQNGSSISDLTGGIGKLYGPECYAKYAAHAINSHDELVEMNKELLNQVMVLESRLLSARRSWPDKCPITRRNFFMEIDGVPTYGGPYDSYTIPEMTGTPDQHWHDRELFVRRFDHDRGHWVDDEVIDLRIIHDGVLDDLIGDKEIEGGAA